MATSTDYTGRTVDVLIFQGAAPVGDQPIGLGFGTDGGQITTGIQKLSQTFTVLFLTRKGTVISNAKIGTDFITYMQQGRIQTEDHVLTAFGAAVEDIKRLFDADSAQADLEDDERFSSAELKSYTIDKVNSKIILVIDLESLAGSSRTIYLPVSAAIK